MPHTAPQEMAPFSSLIRLTGDYADFRAGILAVNSIVRNEMVTGLDGIKGGMDNGDTVGTYFPHPRDKDSLLELAFDLAQEHAEPAGAAMQLGAAIPIIHPFLDGNGRTSRATHAVLLGKSDEKIAELEIAKPRSHDDWAASYLARQKVDLKPPCAIRFGIVERLIYKQTRIPQTEYRSTVTFDEADREIYDAVIKECDPALREDLDTVFKIYPAHEPHLNELHYDHESLRYALNVMAASGGHIVAGAPQDLNGGRDIFILVDMPRTLVELGEDGRRELTELAWFYRSLAAELTINCLSASGLGQEILRGAGEKPITIAEYYRRSTNNLVAA